MLKNKYIKLARLEHGDKFSYKLLPEIIKREDNIEIICNKHGLLTVNSRAHLRNITGCCELCKKEYQLIKRHESLLMLITKAHKKFNNKFEYVISNTNNSESVIKIKCPIHGIQATTMYKHLNSITGCCECGKDKSISARTTTFKEFKQLAQSLHKDETDNPKYLYDHIDTFVNLYTKIPIICPIEGHGVFIQKPSIHLQGHGCPKCGNEKKAIGYENFVFRSREIHGDKYTYYEDTYINVNERTTIKCDCGNIFRQRPSNHMSGQGCKKCKISLGEQKLAEILMKYNIPFVRELKLKQKYRYDFYLPLDNILIEYDGEQHHKPIEAWGGINRFINQVCWDMDKNKIARDFGYVLIRIPYTKFNILENHVDKLIKKYNITISED